MTLRHSLFDKIFISFLVIFTVCFGFIVLYASNVTRSMLVDDRTEVLTNEAFLIADQTVAGYVQGVYTKDELQESLRYYSDKLNASIWVTDEKGIIYGFANADGHPDNPKNIFLVDPDFDIYTAQSFNGKFYNTFKSNVISVAIPIHINNQPNGMLLIHSTVEQLQNIQEKIVKLIYAPYLFMIIIPLPCSVSFLARSCVRSGRSTLWQSNIRPVISTRRWIFIPTRDWSACIHT